MKNRWTYISTPLSLITITLFIFQFFYAGKKDSPSPNANREILNIQETPSEISYCGESVPLKDPEVRERFEKELITNAFWESSTLMHLKRMSRFFPLFEEKLKSYGLPKDLKYISVAESGMTNVVSPAGAAGYWQFMPETGKMYGLEINAEVDERYHVEKATDAACRYLRDSHQKLGNWTLATAAYNCGNGGVIAPMNFQQVNSYYDLYLNQETSRYIFRIMALKEILENPTKYKYQISNEQQYKPLPTKKVEVNYAIPNLAYWAIEKGINYKTLKYYNPWLRKHSLTNKFRKTYIFELPENI